MQIGSISHTYLLNLESGHNENPSIHVLVAISRFYRVSLDELVTAEDGALFQRGTA